MAEIRETLKEIIINSLNATQKGKGAEKIEAGSPGMARRAEILN